jgi:hypothetical protein
VVSALLLANTCRLPPDQLLLNFFAPEQQQVKS